MTFKIEEKNALIESTMLGYEDHGILTFSLHLKYDGSGQGFGGYALDQWSEAHKERISSRACGTVIKRILETVGVEKWEDLKGEHIRVRAEFNKVHAIGNFLKDKWFYPADELSAD